ncbi:hypothetical protein J8273_5180 [Carpediemonas membranifera]|uniref:Uncharacterized protein n=1 Tax=Carpediemonas membranifera TaxID=201153 RepID=A0A8J6E0G7_9EUKA|nr:hypothetical protein J8273_5180 [Carpediemonas membranifera]|eukprot:KAG9392198.1 hypothetical protein J8273_5180 [Carpediemonas membranifera]
MKQTGICLLILLQIVTVAMCYRTAQMAIRVPDVDVVRDEEFTYITMSDDHQEVTVLATTRTIATDDVAFNYFESNFHDIGNDDVVEINPHTFTVTNVTNVLTGTSNPCSDKGSATPHLFLRSKVDKVVSVNYDGTQLAEASIPFRTDDMPMYCDGTSVFQLTLPYTEYTEFDNIIPYNKDGISVILAGQNDGTAYILSANTDCSDFASNFNTTDFDEVVANSFGGRIAATKEVASGSFHYGFIEYDPAEQTWAFAVDAWYNVTSDGASILYVQLIDDELNGVSSVSAVYADGTTADDMAMHSVTHLADANLHPIDGTEESITFTLADYPCLMGGNCFHSRMRVYSDLYMNNDYSTTTTGNVTSGEVLYTAQRPNTDAAAWVKVGLLAVLLALLVLA